MVKAKTAAGRQAAAVLSLANVHKSYPLQGADEVKVLRGIDLEIGKGEFVAITGASGSGKSTLLNLIGCLDVPTSGRVEVNGVSTSQLGDAELSRLRGKEIGFVFQSFNLLPNLTAFENAATPMRIHEYPESEVVEKVSSLLATVGMEERSGHRPNQLSGGQQQRVAIARALCTGPAILLADEPTGNLDSASGKAVMELLKKINEEGRVTIVVVTHEPEVVKYARRVVHIRDGLVGKAGK